MTDKIYDMRTFSAALKMAMAAEGMTGQITVEDCTGTHTIWVGSPDPSKDHILVLSITPEREKK